MRRIVFDAVKVRWREHCGKTGIEMSSPFHGKLPGDVAKVSHVLLLSLRDVANVQAAC
ncbi:hypothetical protein D3C81_1800940 [compost metagenome]